ncbi:MAG: hypothetical protein KKA19_04935 [Candidatus Margulisbacteria bacterium]|nr:hypothetical protein [Candidatus Margulisiibacteriota bacterium]
MEKINKIEMVLLIFIYLFGLYFWTLPFQNTNIPYGEGDAAIHYFLANHMSSTDKVILHLPNATSVWALKSDQNEDYAKINPKDYLFYSPQFHTDFSIMQIISSDKVIGFYLYLAMVSSLVYFTLYFLIRSLYGVYAGLISGFLILFSLREHLTFLWGQWGTAFTLAFIPLIIYTYYKYSNSVIEVKENSLYAYILVSLLVFQFLFHPLGFFLVGGILIFYSILLIIKYKKVPFNIKRVLVCGGIFLMLITVFAPLQMSQMIVRLQLETTSTGEPITENTDFFLRLFGWYNIPGGGHGIPDFYFSFKNIYYGYWMLPFLLIGITYLVVNRTSKDLLLLSMPIAFYIITHIDLIGMPLGPRFPRLFYFESIMFYPIIALGVTKVTSFINFKGKTILKYVIIAGFVIAVLFINVKSSYGLFNSAYDGIGRLNNEEMEGIKWINQNVPKDTYIMLIGAPTFKQQAWMQAMIPERVIVFDQDSIIPLKDKDLNKTTYVIIDYSFFYLYNNQNGINSLGIIEKNITKNINPNITTKNSSRCLSLIKIKENWGYAMLILIVLTFFFWLFKINGVLVVGAMFLFFFLPYYLVIKNFDFTRLEKVFFSFFIGWGLFPTAVYYLAIVISSMRLSILISVVLLSTVSLILNWKLSKKKSESTS